MRGAEYNWLTTVLMYLPQHIWLAPPASLLVVSIIKRNRSAIACNVLALIIVISGPMGLRFPIHRSVADSGTALRVMTWNVHGERAGLENVAREIKKQNPDVVCLQEANTGDWKSQLPAEMESLMPGCHIARARELATLSKYPIRHQEVHRMQASTGRAVLVTEIDVQGRRLSVLNTHLSTYAGDSCVRWGGRPQAYMECSVRVRGTQIGILRAVAHDCEGPIVVVGDFNDPPSGTLYNRMLHDFDDAFRLAGVGFGYSFPARLPLWRIDYIFTNDKLGAERCFVPAMGPSDHRPVVADLIILGSDAEE